VLEAAWFWAALALLVFWSLGAYNRLVRLRAQVANRFAELQKALLRYQDLVQDAVTAAASDPEHWRSTASLATIASQWGRLQVAASQAAMALARMNEHPLLPPSAQEVDAACAELDAAWLALVHPDIYAVGITESLCLRWQELGVLIQPDRQRFNDAIAAYNEAIAEFPAVLIARSFKFLPAQGLQ